MNQTMQIPGQTLSEETTCHDRARVSLKLVAQYAKCSVSAAAAVLNKVDNNTRVGEQLKERIERAAWQLGYHPNYAARALRTGRSNVLGVVLQRIDPIYLVSGFWAEFFAGVETAALAGCCDLLSIGSMHAESDIERAIRLLGERQIDALVVPGIMRQQQLDAFDGINEPVALVAPGDVQHPHPRVWIDYAAAMEDAITHLQALGHQTVLWLGYGEQFTLRKRCFDSITRSYGMHVTEHTLHTVNSVEPIASVCEQCIEYFNTQVLPTAIMAYNEIAAMGCLRALQRLMLSVPEDVSVIGFDNFQAHLTNPPLTVISFEIREAGRLAGELALKMVENRQLITEMAGMVTLVPSRLVIRESTSVSRTATGSLSC